MYVKDGIFFHFHRANKYSNSWVPGAQIDFSGRQLNLFNGYYDDFIRQYPVNSNQLWTRAAIQKVKKELNSNLNYDFVNSFLTYFDNVAEDFAFYMRESVFEEIRKDFFSDLPSRKTCLWVLEYDAIDYWRKTMGGKLLKLKLTGVIHKADQRHLPNEVLPGNVIREKAFNYWTGSDGRNPIEEELLFEGIVKVMEEC
ncbi:MAG: DUF2441 domain-containing protein [Chloroflexi bacterium]|nr:DUF2441 domain-containing protein [Chloroflexota bacterium]